MAVSKSTSSSSPLAFLTGNWSKAIKEGDFGAMVDWFLLWFFGVGFLALALAAIAASIGDDGKPAYSLGFRVFALGLVMAGACACTGWLFGLLFGVPRAVVQITDANATAAGKPPAGAGRGTGSRVNTNLEDISDWLTKTLVGVGLTQLTSLPKFLGDLAHDANRYGFQWGDHGQLLALALMLYFVPGGFWLGYVGTRTLLTGLFSLFNAGWQDHVDRAKAVDSLEIDGLNKIRPATGTVVLADAAVMSKPIQDLHTTDEIVAWAAAQARAGNLEVARIALENALGSEPEHPVATRALVKVYLASRLYDQAKKLAKSLPDSPPKMLASLYDQPPVGYTTARDMGLKLIDNDPSLNDSASMHVWLACAYGQEYSNLKHPKDGSQALADGDPKLEASKKAVRAEIEKAVAIDPKMLEVLQQLFDPKDGDLDNDLSAFDDQDLADLLGPKKNNPAEKTVNAPGDKPPAKPGDKPGGKPGDVPPDAAPSQTGDPPTGNPANRS